MSKTHDPDDAQARATQIPLLDIETGDDSLKPWEEIETGRFMPRRIRGSYRGGKLG
jgi:hypothetical protein